MNSGFHVEINIYSLQDIEELNLLKAYIIKVRDIVIIVILLILFKVLLFKFLETSNNAITYITYLISFSNPIRSKTLNKDTTVAIKTIKKLPNRNIYGSWYLKSLIPFRYKMK